MVNFFDSSKEGEADSILKLLKPKTNDSSLWKIPTIEEISPLLANNSQNKNAQSLIKCIELIQTQSKTFQAKNEDLISKINKLVKNTSDDIRKLRFEDQAADLFSEDLTKTVFEERDSCKRKFQNYLKLARAILKSKQEMLDLYRKLDSELITVQHMATQYHQIIENINVCMDSLVYPELIRRKEFESLNKDFISFYNAWVENETKARENFFNHGDLDLLPYAFKKLLVGFIYDEDFNLKIKEGKVRKEFNSFEDLQVSMENYFNTWAKSSDEKLKGKLSEYVENQDNLLMKIKETESLVQSLSSIEKQLRVDLLSAKDEMTKVTMENKDLKDKISHLEITYSRTDETKAQLIKKYESSVTELNSEISKIKKARDHLQGEIDSLQYKLEAYAERENQLQRKLCEEVDNAKSSEAKIRHQQKLNADLKQEISYLSDKCCELTSNSKKMEAALRDLHCELNDMQKRADANNRKRLELEEKLMDSSTTIKSLQEELGEAKAINLSRAAEVSEIKAKLENQKEYMKSIQEKQIQVVKSKTQELIEGQRQEKSSYETQIKDLASEVERLKSYIREAEDQSCLTKSMIDDQDHSLSLLTSQLQDAQKKLEQHQDIERAEAMEREELYGKIKELESTIESHMAINKSLASELETMKEIEKEKKELENQLSTQAVNFEAKINRLQGLLGSGPRVDSTKLVELAIKKIEENTLAKLDEICHSFGSRVQATEQRAIDVEKHVRVMVRNNSMGILLKNMSSN